MASGSDTQDKPSSPRPTTPSSPNVDGSPPRTSSLATRSWQLPRRCAWCGEEFTVRYVQMAKTRFCGRSCSAKWRMRQPEHLAKVHSPEVAAKRGARKRAWLASGAPAAAAELERIRALNPASRPEVRAKISRRLRDMQHAPSVRGGNGRGLTASQAALMAVLHGTWKAEYALSLGRRTAGYPTHYKIDLANIERRIAIEVDGHSHHSRAHLDAKKAAKLNDMGWTVLRFWNWDIQTWIDSGMPMESSISMTLAEQGIQVSASTVR